MQCGECHLGFTGFGAIATVSVQQPVTAWRLTDPAYRLADYLDQYGRHARPGDQGVLSNAAHDRGLCRAAAQL